MASVTIGPAPGPIVCWTGATAFDVTPGTVSPEELGLEVVPIIGVGLEVVPTVGLVIDVAPTVGLVMDVVPIVGCIVGSVPGIGAIAGAIGPFGLGRVPLA